MGIGPGESARRPSGLLFVDIFSIRFYTFCSLSYYSFCLLVLFVVVRYSILLHYYSFCLLVLFVFVCLFYYRVVAFGTYASRGGDVVLISDHALVIALAIRHYWYVGQPVVWRQHPPTPNTYITM